MLELCAKFEIYFGVKNAGVFSSFLQDFGESLNFCSNFSLFGFEIFLDFFLNRCNCLLNLGAANFIFLF